MGICRNSDGTMHLFLNGDDLGEAASGIPKVSHLEVHGLKLSSIDRISGFLFLTKTSLPYRL